MSTKRLEPYGIWHVTTEGDCEGRSVRDLGVHEGFIDEIAFGLAPQAEYSLKFECASAAQVLRLPTMCESVNVSLDIGSGTWDMSKTTRMQFFRQLLDGRPVWVEPCDYYASVCLRRNLDPERASLAQRERLRLVREAALAKLSPEERSVLGVD